MNLTRQRIVDQSLKTGQRVNAYFGRQFSTIYLKWLVVDAVPSEGGAGPVQAYARLQRDDTQIFFSYGYGEQSLDDGFGNKFKPGRDITSIEYAYRLNPQTKFSIERLILQPGKLRVKYDKAPFGVTDPVVVAAYTGTLDPNTNLPPEIHDPLGVLLPAPGTIGPATQHQAFFEAMRDCCTLEFTLGSGGRSSRKLGPLSFFDSGGTEPWLKAFGGFDSGYGYQLPEGILWDSEGNIEGRVGFLLRVERPAIVPIVLNVPIVGDDPVGTRRQIPTQLSLPVRLCCEGMELTTGEEFNR